jgi:hypothetical protein
LAGDERSGRDRGAISNGRRRETHESGPRRCAAQRRHSSSVRFVPHRCGAPKLTGLHIVLIFLKALELAARMVLPRSRREWPHPEK